MNEELVIKIKAELNDFKKGMEEAKKSMTGFKSAVNSVADKAKAAAEKMGKGFVEAGKKISKALAAGCAAAGVAIVALGKQAISAYADYEQLVGGINTLFKDSSKQVQQYAANAYKNQQMSANQYMEIATSFSASLLQGLNGDTAKAAQIADMAITDMADNANKMGSTMESIQNAYQGFAKQNYTMLDNLKLGYGGTKEEMERLLADAEKISGIHYDISNLNEVYEAIHVIQGELGITGTSAEEAATTLQGSAATMKAAWTNLLTGMADENANLEELIQNFIDSVGVFMDNLLPRVNTVLTGVVTLVQQLAPQIIAAIPELLALLLPAAVDAVVSIVNAISANIPLLVNCIVGCVPQIVAGLAATLPTLLQAGVQLIEGLLQGITQTLPQIVETLQGLIPQMVEVLVDGVPALLGAAITLFTAIIDAIPEILPTLIDQIPTIIDGIITTVISSIPLLLQAGISLFNAIIDAIPQIIPALIAALPNIIISIVTALIKAIPQLLKAGIEMFMSLVTSVIRIIPDLISALGQLIKTIATHLVDKVKSLMKFDWSLPKLKLPHLNISGKFSLSPPSVPRFSIDWYANGGVFDTPTLFGYGSRLGGLGEAGAEAVVPLEKNTEWLDKIAERLSGSIGNTPIVLQVDGKTFAQTSISCINDYTRQTGRLGLVLG